MKKLLSLPKTEPVALVGSIVAAYHAVVAYLLVAGIVHATAEQVVALEGAVTAVLSLPVTLLVRNAVTPMARLSASPADVVEPAPADPAPVVPAP